MDQQQAPNTDNTGAVKGMPMFAPGDPEVVAKEQAELRALQSKGVLARYKWYLSKSGPGWMQSAMTLGGGSAFASLFAGAFLGYKLLWVQPLAMLMGVIMLSALAHQTLATRERPFYAMKRHFSPTMAWLWAISAVVSSIIWHFPQYAIAAGMSADIINAVTGLTVEKGSGQEMALLLILGAIFLVIGTLVCWNYASGRKGIKLFEKIIKMVIWLIILCFAIVVLCVAFSEKGIDWKSLFSGFLPYNFADGTWNIPTDKQGIMILIAGLSAAVGINMTFLFGYSYLARGWGKEHIGLAKFDLVTGMLFPFIIATSLMVIATACTINASGALEEGVRSLSPQQAASMFQSAGIPMVVSRLIFGIGITGMMISTIILQMLVCGFAACEIFGVDPTGWKYRLACLIPAPGVFGVIIWTKIGSWIAIPVSAACLIMLPIAYIGFFALNNCKEYLGDEMPTGLKRFVWNTAMIATILIIIASAIYLIYMKVPGYIEKIQGLF